MSAKLYEKCPVCKGARTSWMGGTCLSCMANGYVETGLTVAQVDRLVTEERSRRGDPAAVLPPTALDVCRMVSEFWGDHGAWGDFASLTSAAGKFAPIADAARKVLESEAAI